MRTDRRTLLKGLVTAAAVSAVPVRSEARERRQAPEDAVGMLYDATRCIGCKTCTVACKDRAKLPADTDGYGGGLYDAPEGLNQYTKTVIQLYREGNEYSYVKKQCMHCIDPACVNACMLGSLTKGKYGIVDWDPSRCVGCRYCQVACPHEVPKFEWANKAPKIVKCDFCRDRVEQGKSTACAEQCPRDAITFGKWTDLVKEGHRRIDAEPDKYVQKVYGERELGGTQVLYLSHVPFEKLGFRYSDETAVPDAQQSVQNAVYRGFIAPVALYGVLAAVLLRRRRAESVDTQEGGEDGQE